MYAAGVGHTDVVQLLLSKNNVDVNMTDEVNNCYSVAIALSRISNQWN